MLGIKLPGLLIKLNQIAGKIQLIMKKTEFFLTGLIIIGLTVTLSSYDLPTGWFKAGSSPESYEMGIDKGAGQNGNNAATIKSINKKIKGFGTLMQNSLPAQYLGKRVRMKGYLKTKDVADWCGFWLRIDQSGSDLALSFDNMSDRSVKGTTEWTKYEIVLDVPLRASNIAFGALLSGTGQIWFDNLSFETVDNSVPTTGKVNDYSKPLGDPVNLDFEQ